FIPSQSLQDQYKTLLQNNKEMASEHFIVEFKKQLDEFYNKVVKAAQAKNITPIELLPFKENDTLVSWERKANTHYRGLIAELLKKLGYEIVEN
ncbi:MAG: hypothetical protein WC679_14215, partial [Bacteroidales bacterium]